MTNAQPHTAGRDERGVLYLCTGARGDLLRNSVASLSRTNPELSFFVLADRPYDLPFQWVKSWTGMASRRIKTQLYKYSPYNRTLFVDDDTVFAKPVALDEMLGDADFGVALDVLSDLVQAGTMVKWSHHVSQAEVDETIGLCGRESPFYNTGVMVWRNNSATRQLFDRWNQEWLKYRMCDQFAFVRALNSVDIRFKVLDPCYNSPVFNRKFSKGAHIFHLLRKEWAGRQIGCWNPPPEGPFEASFYKAVKRGLMMENQYRVIARELWLNQPRNLLVIGGGHDAELWWHCVQGRVAYVEDDPKYAALLPRKTALFKFESRVGRWGPVPDPPPEIANCWDAVIVDGPNGFKGDCPGRQISIAWASRLARRAIFVHDYERRWERTVCKEYLGVPDEVVHAKGRSDRKLAVYRFSGNGPNARNRRDNEPSSGDPNGWRRFVELSGEPDSHLVK